jgi:hypothetical protein
MAVVAYPESFDKIINLVIRLNNNFRRLKYAQEKSNKRVRNSFYRKERDSNIMD